MKLRGKVIGLSLLLVLVNLLAWSWALIALGGTPLLLGTALLAYSFGLRHAVDADHIAAIDNVTRKLMQEGKRPVAVGLFFSLGHAAVVTAMTAAVAVTAAVAAHFEAFKAVGGMISTTVSALFLFALALANMVILKGVWRAFRTARRGGRVAEEDFDLLLVGGGVMTRLFRRLFRLVEQSWHMFPIGLLFGLGFETATEVGLLGLSSSAAGKGLSVWSIMVFPALFTAGMSLVDTADGILMLGVYNWAFIKPIRKLYYNLTITALSVAVALAVGGIELFNPPGALWSVLGYGIIGIFAAGWLVSAAIYRWKGYDAIA